MRCHQSRPAAVLSITGEDHQDFLQGQGTADLRGPSGFCRYNLWLDYKGHILGDAHVLKVSDDEMLLVSDATPAQELLAKFDRHIIADDVDIEDITARYTLMTIPPESLMGALEALNTDVPKDGSITVLDDAILFIGRRLGEGTLHILATSDPFAAVPGERLNEDDCEAIRVAAGMPLVPQDTDDHTLNPIEANILSPISFTKGCYLGQEVVARVERLGRVTRRLASFRSDNPSGFSPGPLHLQGQEVGILTSVVVRGDNSLAIGWLKSKISNGRIGFDEGTIEVNSLPVS